MVSVHGPAVVKADDAAVLDGTAMLLLAMPTAAARELETPVLNGTEYDARLLLTGAATELELEEETPVLRGTE